MRNVEHHVREVTLEAGAAAQDAVAFWRRWIRKLPLLVGVATLLTLASIEAPPCSMQPGMIVLSSRTASGELGDCVFELLQTGMLPVPGVTHTGLCRTSLSDAWNLVSELRQARQVRLDQCRAAMPVPPPRIVVALFS